MQFSRKRARVYMYFPPPKFLVLPEHYSMDPKAIVVILAFGSCLSCPEIAHNLLELFVAQQVLVPAGSQIHQGIHQWSIQRSRATPNYTQVEVQATKIPG